MDPIKGHIEGRIGKAPELKTSSSDKPYCAINIATEKFVGEGKGDERDGKPTAYHTTWVSVLVTGKQAEFVADRFSPGDTIIIDGPLELETYEKKDDQGNGTGEFVTKLKCFAREISGPFRVVKKGDGNGGNGGGQQTSQPAQQSTGTQRQNTPRQSAPAQRQSAPAQQPAAQRQAAAPRQQAAAPAQTQPTATAIIDDDIPF